MEVQRNDMPEGDNKIEELGSLLETYERVLKRSESKPVQFDPQEHKDKTRSKIALYFTIGYFALMSLVLVGIPVHNILIDTQQLSLEDISY